MIGLFGRLFKKPQNTVDEITLDSLLRSGTRMMGAVDMAHELYERLFSRRNRKDQLSSEDREHLYALIAEYETGILRIQEFLEKARIYLSSSQPTHPASEPTNTDPPFPATSRTKSKRKGS